MLATMRYTNWRPLPFTQNSVRQCDIYQAVKSTEQFITSFWHDLLWNLLLQKHLYIYKNQGLPTHTLESGHWMV